MTDVTAAAISPDGRRLVFTVMDAAGTMRLWMRPLDSLAAQPLAGTENAIFPFWSPDSRFVAFFAEGKLRKVPVGRRLAGGDLRRAERARRILEQGRRDRLRAAVHGSPAAGLGRRRRAGRGREAGSGAGRDRAALPVLPPRRQALPLREPAPAAGGLRRLRRRAGLEGAQAHHVRGLGAGLRRARLPALRPRRPPGRPAVRRDRSLQPVGEVVPLGDAPPPSTFDGGTALSASANGVLAHAATSPPTTELVWLDRAGRQTGQDPAAAGQLREPVALAGRPLGHRDEVQLLHQLRPLAGGPAARRDDPPHLRRPGRRRLGHVRAGGLVARRHAASPTATTGPASTTCTRCSPAGRGGRSRWSSPT